MCIESTVLALQQPCLVLSMAAMAVQLHPQQGVLGGGRDTAASAVCAGRGILWLRSCWFLPARLAMDGGGCSGLLS